MSKLSLSVQPKRPLPALVTGPADLRDRRWLDERIETARSGIEAVIDIALNWTEGRNVSRLHPGVSAADYVREHVGLIGREAIIPLLTESNWSNRQIAAAAGMDEGTVRNELRNIPQLDRPAETLGADGRLRIAPRVITSAVADERSATPFRLIAQTFERDVRHLLDAYRVHLDDGRFAARFGAVLAAIEDALQEGK